MEDRNLFDLYRERGELLTRLSHLEERIRRIEHDLWRKHQQERDAALSEDHPK